MLFVYEGLTRVVIAVAVAVKLYELEEMITSTVVIPSQRGLTRAVIVAAAAVAVLIYGHEDGMIITVAIHPERG